MINNENITNARGAIADTRGNGVDATGLIS